MSAGPDSTINIENDNTSHGIHKQVSAINWDKITGRRLLKNGIWVYFFLLIFEGALRKWVFPGLATPLLVVRDPVALWLFFTAWKYDELPSSSSVLGMIFIAVLAIGAALTVGHGNLVVAIYGARILLIHFPLIFLIGRVFDRDDVIKMAKAMLIIAIPMFVLIALQFYSPQGSLINRGVGGDVQGGGFSGSLGYFRPPGTFSFTTGNSQFFGFVGAVVIYFWLNPGQVSRTLLLAATISLIAAIPLSISRTLFFQISLSSIFAAISIVRKPKYLSRMLVAMLVLILITLLISRVSFVAQAIDALTNRFIDASNSEGTLQDTFANRFLGGIFEPFESSTLPFFGFGIGMGTNAGAQLLVGHADEFLISEGEWGRLIGEMGAFLGIAAILLRVNICLKLIRESYIKLVKNDFLPWMLLSISLQALAQGQWAQPTALGFAVIVGGLSIASLKVRET
jgi:hypothetical protein